MTLLFVNETNRETKTKYTKRMTYMENSLNSFFHYLSVSLSLIAADWFEHCDHLTMDANGSHIYAVDDAIV